MDPMAVWLGQILHLSVLHTCKMGIITILAYIVMRLKKDIEKRRLSLEVINPQSILFSPL